MSGCPYFEKRHLYVHIVTALKKRALKDFIFFFSLHTSITFVLKLNQTQPSYNSLEVLTRRNDQVTKRPSLFTLQVIQKQASHHRRGGRCRSERG